MSITSSLRGFAQRLLLLLLAFTAPALAADASQDFWQNTQAAPLPSDAPALSIYRPLRLDVARMNAHLAAARKSGTAITLAIPRPDGGYAEFLLADSHTMPDALQDKFPSIVSLAGSDAEDRKVRVDISPLGFQAMVFDPDGIWIVRPETYGGGERYLSFRRSDLAATGSSFRCDAHPDPVDPAGRNLVAPPAPMTTTGATERVFRAAVAANHQYVAAVGGGTVSGGLAAIVTAMNRVNEVYETELAVHMELIPNEDLIIYASAAGDPYSNDGNALSQNQANLDSVIGSANYDIGHVFTTGSGGVAGLRVTCINGQKARGTTGLSNPIGDTFYIDYVAHEMGHQFGGNHTFNSQTSACGGGNRAGSAAYEPGSGSTIMAYAGICGADNLQAHSDPYFHSKSLEEINGWIGTGGGACAADTASGDAPPVIDLASLPPEVTIPMHTPFALSGEASDPDGDPITYNWEQYDLGPPTTLAQGDTGDGPIFRSFNATEGGTRIFPKIESVLGAPLVHGEAWPATTRDLSFRLTVRDNHDVPGTPQYGATVSANNIQIHVTEDAGPFAVTRPNTAITWGRGQTRVVTWDVAGTDAPSVSCANVAIDLSNDGGFTYAFPLVASTANSGTASVVVPAVPDTSTARVRVACVDSIFFDVSDVNFNVAATGDTDPGVATASVSPTYVTMIADAGATATATLTVDNLGDASTTLNFTATESNDGCVTPGDVPWFDIAPTGGAVAGGGSASVTVTADTNGLAPGVYPGCISIDTDDALHPHIPVAVYISVIDTADTIFSDGFDGAPQVQDASFEATTADAGANPYWNAMDSNPNAAPGATPFYSASGAGIPVRTGNWAARFGGWHGGTETQSFWQYVTIPRGRASYLNYWAFNATPPDAPGQLVVSIDTTWVEIVDFSSVPPGAGYVAHSIDVSALGDGRRHILQFQYTYDDSGTGRDGDIYLDDATIDAAPATPFVTTPAVFARPQR